MYLGENVDERVVGRGEEEGNVVPCEGNASVTGRSVKTLALVMGAAGGGGGGGEGGEGAGGGRWGSEGWTNFASLRQRNGMVEDAAVSRVKIRRWWMINIFFQIKQGKSCMHARVFLCTRVPAHDSGISLIPAPLRVATHDALPLYLVLLSIYTKTSVPSCLYPPVVGHMWCSTLWVFGPFLMPGVHAPPSLAPSRSHGAWSCCRAGFAIPLLIAHKSQQGSGTVHEGHIEC